jgi:hypothetical protein
MPSITSLVRISSVTGRESCVQSYKIIGYLKGLYICENLTFHLQTEKDVKFVSEMMCFYTMRKFMVVKK